VYTVGEQGQETVYLPQGARVDNATRTRAAGGAGAGEMHLHLHVTQPLGTPDQIARAVVPAITNYARNGGTVPWR
jgi:hypothetical protein